MTKPAETKLSDTQLVLLSTASQRDDSIIPIHERLKGSVATGVGNRLLSLGLAEERQAGGNQPGWRDDVDGERLVLVITRLGLAAIGVDEDCIDEKPARTDSATPTDEQGSGQSKAVLPARPTSRPGSKKALVIGMLWQGDGASIDEIAAATGWLAHTVRAFLTGLRKAGLSIETIRHAGEKSRYRVADRLTQNVDTEAAAPEAPSAPAEAV